MTNIVGRLEFIIQAVFRKQRNCPHCYGHNLERLARKYYLIGVMRCIDCGLSFTSPIYKSQLVRSFYDSLYEGHEATTDLPTDRQLAQCKNNGFSQIHKDYTGRLKCIRKVLSPRGSEPPRLLELGSSWGYFIYQAKKLGFDEAGVEVSERRRQFGKQKLGVIVYKNLEVVQRRDFDIVYTSHTLEHFTDVSTVFENIALCLKRNGFLLIEVPNFDFRKRRTSALNIIGAVHPLGFDSEFFIANLPKYGFNILGFYDDWEDFPDKPVPESNGGEVIVLAQKIS